MKLQKVVGSTSEIWQVFIQDSSSSTGAGLAGLAFNSSSLTAYYHRDTDTTATAITLVTMTVGTFTSSGFKEIDATNMPGWYQFCPPNAALASGAKSVGIQLKGATNMAQLNIEVQLTAGFDLDTATPAVNTTKIGGTTQTARDLGASVLLSSGTGTGQLDFTSGVVKANVTQYGGTNGTFASGRPEVNMTHIAGSAVSTSTAQLGVNVVNFGGSAGTFAAGRPETNTTHIAGAAVSTSTAQLGVNVVNFGGSAGTFAAGRPETNTTHIAGSAVSTASAQIGVNVVNAGGTAWGSGAITAASIATDAITAAKIAADAIGASELAADAVTEIQSGLSTLTASGVRTAVGLASANLDTQLAALPTATSNADALLARDIGSGTNAGSAQERTVRAALRFLRNKFTISGSTLTVRCEDDSTMAWTAAVTTTAGNPVTQIDPT